MLQLRARDGALYLAFALSIGACGAERETSGRVTAGSAAVSGGPPAGGAGSPSAPAPAPSGPIGFAGTGEIPTVPAVPPPIMTPDKVCDAVHLAVDPQTPDMMIVLDRSGSMAMGSRWVPSVSAVRRVTTELQARIRFGLAMFPDPAATNPVTTVTTVFDCLMSPDPQTCLDAIDAAQGSSCAPGTVVVPVAAANATAIGDALDTAVPGGGTPTAETLERLVSSYANGPVGPDVTGVHAKYVLLVTDGQPTCPTGMGENTTQADIDASNNALDSLLLKDVRTYVIGYDTTGPGNEELTKVLDTFAVRGGTGDTKHRPVEDEASLLAELQSIAGEIVGCSFSLDKAPERADHVLVRMDGKQVNLSDADGWKLVGDRTIELTGKACETFKSGAHTLDAEVQCAVVGPA